MNPTRPKRAVPSGGTRTSPVRAMSCGLLAVSLSGCGSVPVDPGPRVVPPKGVIRGAVVYQGPRPCSRDGHIVGNAVILVFDRRNLPPPVGLASTAVNFADVTGDVLFANEPRYTGPETYCPLQAGFTETITASAPFEVSPLAGGSYELQAFFDYTGNFLPEFKIRNLPERGDVAGGAVDTVDAIKPGNAGNPNYRPLFLPVNVGVPGMSEAGGSPAAVPPYVLPDDGFVADDVTVTIAAPIPSTRPYFFAQGEELDFDLTAGAVSVSVSQSSDSAAVNTTGIAGAAETDVNTLPILTIPQDIAVLAPPVRVTPESALYFESKFPHIRLEWGVPAGELGQARGSPFDMQVATFGPGAGFLVWQDARLDGSTGAYTPQQIPEGNGVPALWPQVVLVKIADPQATTPEPLVILEGITLLGQAQGDSFLGTVTAGLSGSLFQGGAEHPVVSEQDHLTVMLRPSVICVPPEGNGGGTLVTPHPMGTTADLDCSTPPCVPNGTPDQPIAPPDLLTRPALASLVTSAVTGCLPTGRYAINVVYPDGQAWTVPNEAGVCAQTEGPPEGGGLTCTLKPRPVLYSQGARAVVEVVGAGDPTSCPGGAPPVCLASHP